MIQRLDALEVKSQAVDAAARKAAQVAEAAVQRIDAMEKQQSSGKAGRWVAPGLQSGLISMSMHTDVLWRYPAPASSDNTRIFCMHAALTCRGPQPCRLLRSPLPPAATQRASKPSRAQPWATIRASWSYPQG